MCVRICVRVSVTLDISSNKADGWRFEDDINNNDSINEI